MKFSGSRTFQIRFMGDLGEVWQSYGKRQKTKGFMY